jgi:hypothetical protein
MAAPAMSYFLNLDRRQADGVMTSASVKRQVDELSYAEAIAGKGSMSKHYYDILKSRQGGLSLPVPTNVPAPVPRSKTSKMLPVQPISIDVEKVERMYFQLIWLIRIVRENTSPLQAPVSRRR